MTVLSLGAAGHGVRPLERSVFGGWWEGPLAGVAKVEIEQAERLPKAIHDRVLALVERLEKWPAASGTKALSGNLAGWYRLRTGDYRVRFYVKGETVVVDKIGHRREFYED
jgi:mRNA interferase RelE/StbE